MGPFIPRQLEHNIRSERLVAVAHNRRNAGKRSKLLGRALRITSGHDNARVWIPAVCAANKCACFTIGFGGNAASVYNHHISYGRRAFAHARCTQTAAQRLAISPSRPAAEMLNMKLRHHFSLLPRRAQRRRRRTARNFRISYTVD